MPAALAVIQLTAMLVLAGFTVARFRIFGIDEGAHIAYVESVAEHARLPSLWDMTPWQVQALDLRTYPHRSQVPARDAGLAGTSYEAFQMPLYYVLAAPAYLIGGHDFITKVRVLRGFDVLLLIAAIVLLGLLARAIFRRQWLLPFCMALSVLMWPGVLVRQITVSYAALELPIALAFVYACWQATMRNSSRWLVAAGVLLGLALLTSLLLVCLAPLLLMPIVSRLRSQPSRPVVGAVVLAIAVPLAMLAPWVAMNENRYGAVTAEKIIKSQQRGIIDPGGHPFGLHDVTRSEWAVTRALLPEEWWSQAYAKPVREKLLRVIPIALVLLAIAACFGRRSPVWPRAQILLGSPFVIALAALGAGIVIVQWPTLFPRYLSPELILLGLLAGSRLSTTRSRHATLTIAAVMTIAVTGVWVTKALGIATG
jgi:4-amino-4-deoxy-L-arabinose transferase-like glycosyltransferase